MTPLHRAANAISLTALCAVPAVASAGNQTLTRNSVRPSTSGDVCAGNSLSSATEPRNVLELRRAFGALHGLADGWDGEGSAAPLPSVVSNAASVIAYALKNAPMVDAPAIVPVADGGLQAEWYSDTHRFEAYFEPDGQIAVWSENRVTGVEREAERGEAVQMLVSWAATVNDEHRALA